MDASWICQRAAGELATATLKAGCSRAGSAASSSRSSHNAVPFRVWYVPRDEIRRVVNGGGGR
jgi:hypothetical protein